MSWQSYIDDQLLASGFCYAAIVGAEDGATWACSKGYTVLKDEAIDLGRLLKGSSLDSIASKGFKVAGQSYAFIRGEVDDEEGGVPFIQGRSKQKSDQGIIVMRTNKTLVIGVHDPAYANGASFGKVNTDIGRVADYMNENGF